MPSSKRKSEQSKQPARPPPEDDIVQQAPKSILEHLQSGAKQEELRDELGGTDKYAERANKIHPVKLSRSPPSPYALPSRSPQIRPYNISHAPPTTTWNGPNVSPPFAPANGRQQTGLSPPNTYNSRVNIPLNHAHLSVSPPTSIGGRPLSHPNSVPTFGGRSPPNNNMYAGSRRASMFSQYSQSQRPLSGRVPLPHEDQAHFYSAPQLDFGAPTQPGGTGKAIPGDNGYFCGFDSLDGTGDAGSARLENVIICGYEGGLEVYNVQHDGVQLIGVLEGLKGGVIDAKFLPWSDRDDPLATLRPLIAVTVHGPVTTDDTLGGGGTSNDQAIADSPNVLPTLSDSEAMLKRLTSYQTSVQVYSLATRKLVSTLYTAPTIPIAMSMDSPDFEPPAPSLITLEACGKFVVVGIGGRSGEVYVFTPATSITPGSSTGFRCLGKLWTSVQTAKLRKDTNAGATLVRSDSETEELKAKPIFSLSARWLALVPPPTSSHFSSYGEILDQNKDASAPGLTVSMSPAPPAISCAVDTPDDRFVSRMSRLAAKNIAKGAQWASDYGKQLWKQYMGQQPTQAAPDGRLQQHQADLLQQHFPPTHAANDIPRISEDTTAVAVYDLERMLAAAEKKSKTVPSPVAVFEQALGCSFLSFAPSGLHLLTVSKKGDTQVLWDLKRISHGRGVTSGPRGSASLGPHVREVTRITRVTDANVIDVIWGAPKDEKLAVLTDKGTLHVHLIDAALLQWPPPRRLPRQGQAHGQNSSTQQSKHTSPEPASPSTRSRLNSAYDAVNGATSWLSSIRSRSVSNGTGLPSLSSLSLTPVAGARSAKAVAASAGKAIGKGVHDIRHAADNKIYLRATGPISARCIMWMAGDSRGLICTVADGNVKMFRVRSVVDAARGKSGRESRRVALKPMHEVHLQGLPAHGVGQAMMNALGAPASATDNALDSGETGATRVPQSQGMWQPRLPTGAAPPSTAARNDRRASSERTMWKSYAELQTTAPYAKFHTDPRVSMFVYTDGAQSSVSSSHFGSPAGGVGGNELIDHHHDSSGSDNAQWVFGGDIPVRKISTGAGTGAGAGGVGRHGIAAAAAGVIPGEDDDADGFVWRNARDGDGDGEDGFFEDDADVIDFAEDRV